VVGSDEEYFGAPHADLGLAGTLISATGVKTSNARVYAIYPDGTLHPAAPGAPAPAGMPDPGAFLPGWPVPVADLDANLLPTSGDGVTASPTLADVGNGQLDVVTQSVAGPVYVLRPDGTSALGTGPGGLPVVTAVLPAGGSLADVLDDPLPALGEPVAAPVGPPTAPVSNVAPTAGLGRLLDEEFPARQSPAHDQISAYSARSGAIEPGFPAAISDLQIDTQPIVATVGPGGEADVVEGSGLYDLRAYDATGAVVPGFPKFTGGWVFFGPVFGTWGDQVDQVLAVGTRSGVLLAWKTRTKACAPSGPWPQVHHDAGNSQNLETPATSPGRCP
jgi:hypothetical protein